MKRIMVLVFLLYAANLFASDLPIFEQYEQYEVACTNLIASVGYPQSGIAYTRIKRICMEDAFKDPASIAEWLPKKEDPLDKALRACRAEIPLYPRGISCLALEIEKIGRQ